MRRLLFFPALLALAAPAVARADAANDTDLRTFRPSTDRNGTLATEGLSTPGHLKLEFAHWLVFESASLRFDSVTGERTRVLGPRLLGEPTVAIGLGKRAALGASIPYAIYQSGEASPLTDDHPIAAQGIGDLAFTGKAVALEADPDALKPGVSFVGRVQLPTGDRSSFISDRGSIVDLRALVGFDLMRLFQFTATAGYRMRFVQHPITDVTIGDTIPWGLTLSLKPRVLGVDTAGKWKVNLEGHGEIGAVPNGMFKSTRVSPAFLGLSARYEISPSFSLFAGVEQGLTPAIGAPTFRGIFGLTYAPTVIDDDQDGVADDVDECPGLPEDGQGKKPHDGCPDYEGEETTPVVEPKVEEPLPTPPTPPVAAPPADTDADGIPDEIDKCPDQPETKNGYEDDDGCPEIDKDFDTFLDAVDHCPNEPETFNGVTDEDGCPEEAPAKGKPAPKLLLTEGKGTLVLTRPIKFEINTPAKESTSDLRAIAAWLLGHPGTHIRVSVKPEGKGEEANKVATTRAISVVEALVAFAHTGGIAEAVPWDPKATSKTNVLITIVGQEPPTEPKPAAKPAEKPAAKPAPAAPAPPKKP